MWSTIDLARNLGLEVVAEGVGASVAYNLLRGFGCDFGQGFLLSRPLPADGFEAWFHDRQGWLPTTLPTGLEVVEAG